MSPDISAENHACQTICKHIERADLSFRVADETFGFYVEIIDARIINGEIRMVARLMDLSHDGPITVEIQDIMSHNIMEQMELEFPELVNVKSQVLPLLDPVDPYALGTMGPIELADHLYGIIKGQELDRDEMKELERRFKHKIMMRDSRYRAHHRRRRDDE